MQTQSVTTPSSGFRLRRARPGTPAVIRLIACLCLCVSAGVSAEGGDGSATESQEPVMAAGVRVTPVPAELELAELLSSAERRSVTELRVGEVRRIADLLSVAHKQRAHVRRSVMLSTAAPGLGHYINGETGRALAFASAELAVQLAAGITGLLLLPAPVRIANLNYLQTPSRRSRPGGSR